MAKRMFTLVIDADSDSAYEDALSEATRLMNEGNFCGKNSNEEGAFYFESTENVPEEKMPRR